MHDPKVANEREVKAQIKLKFKNVTKRSLVLSRSMTLSVTQKKQTFKTLDTTLMIETNKGEVPQTCSSSFFSVRLLKMFLWFMHLFLFFFFLPRRT